jgi:hypothetical protein
MLTRIVEHWWGIWRVYGKYVGFCNTVLTLALGCVGLVDQLLLLSYIKSDSPLLIDLSAVTLDLVVVAVGNGFWNINWGYCFSMGY